MANTRVLVGVTPQALAWVNAITTLQNAVEQVERAKRALDAMTDQSAAGALVFEPLIAELDLKSSNGGAALPADAETVYNLYTGLHGKATAAAFINDVRAAASRTLR